MKPGPAKDYLNMYEVQENGCWRFTGCIQDNGYGSIRNTPAHRYFYLSKVGAVPDGFQVDHQCHVANECRRGSGCEHRACVNIDHLKAMPARENLLRSNSFVARNARATHCPQGHEYAGSNLIQGKQRSCRQCMASSDRKTKAKRSRFVATSSNLRPLHRAILDALSGEPLTDREVAAALGVARQTVVLYRGELERSAFVARAGTRPIVKSRRPAITWVKVPA